MASLRNAAQCIGLTGPFSVAHDFFGFWIGTPAGMTVSVGRQVSLLKGRHFHLNLIRLAFFNDGLRAKVDHALQHTRDIYARVGIGVGRIGHFKVPQGGYEILMSEDVALDLWDSWSAPNDGIDAFLTYQLAGEPSGRSPEDGSCDKDDKDSGLAVGVIDNPTADILGDALAHELGHYLGLGHEDELADNLMYPSVPNAGGLYGGQVGVIKLHCALRAGCNV